MDEIIKLYGTSWCGGTRRARRIFDDNKIAYQWIDIDLDKEARSIVEQINHGNRSVPTIVFPDGSILVEPSDGQLAEKLGVTPPRSFF
ncbi:glutaredoxin domain-containing protein [Leptolinea tardivitalis]|uniref:Glutaredoxin n=1 Tax=Leptolinea tardivitalis TaxID=229920 RepID=A0A0P6WMF4_9CHLR|nr:glutaredoxin domain-containing protein [Leptolinea tardivitalis]KPL69957.1 glutaredoxin [Leptolinea tardivitalis]GAP20593.1 glutaredoxin [Leptolinea tardivitalis]